MNGAQMDIPLILVMGESSLAVLSVSVTFIPILATRRVVSAQTVLEIRLGQTVSSASLDMLGKCSLHCYHVISVPMDIGTQAMEPVHVSLLAIIIKLWQF